ncbi:MAG TPA: DUF2231 domain-containing protein [Microlunatus sp.]
MTVFGLPLHPLIVHATVVIVPTAALAVLLAAFWPRFRAWASWGPLALSLLAVVLVPLTSSSGESLEHALPHSELIEQHAHLGDQLLPLVIVLAVGAIGVSWPMIIRLRAGLPELPRWLTVVVLILVLAGAVGTVVQVVRIGHSGAEAAWSDVA